jgi:aspartate dehydrogenase
LTNAQIFFRGSAREAAYRFPVSANVAAISALAGIGFDRMNVELVADPNIEKIAIISLRAETSARCI